jgi:hypothetical protein
MDKPFKFSNRDLEFKIVHDLKLLEKMGKSFDFIYDKLVKKNAFLDVTNLDEIDLETISWDEGKNYNWCTIKDDKLDFIIRKYGNHHTIYTRLTKIEKFNTQEYKEFEYSGLTFHTNTENLSDELSDFYCDQNSHDLNIHFKELCKFIKGDKFESLWNDYSFKRPKHVEIEQIFNGRERIYSVDKLMFCAEELSSSHEFFFAENEMVDKLKTLKVGDKFGNNSIIKEINLKYLKDEEIYYNGVGLTSVYNDDVDSKGDWHDVYSLTHYYFEEVFGKKV